MAAQLKNIVSFTSIAVGASQVLSHSLHNDSRALIPDVLTPSIEGVALITADATNVTVTNESGAALTIDVLCESWHTIERAFGGVQNTALSPQPFIIGMAQALGSMLVSIIYGSGQDGIADFDGVNAFSFATKVGSVYTLTRDIFITGPSFCRAGVTIYTAGFRGFCNAKFTVELSGIIHNDGKNAVGVTAGAASAVGTTQSDRRRRRWWWWRLRQCRRQRRWRWRWRWRARVARVRAAGGAQAGGAGGTYATSSTNGCSRCCHPIAA